MKLWDGGNFSKSMESFKGGNFKSSVHLVWFKTPARVIHFLTGSCVFCSITNPDGKAPPE